MFYPVDLGFSMLVFGMIVVGFPVMLLVRGAWSLLQQWDDERRADAYVKRVMGE